MSEETVIVFDKNGNNINIGDEVKISGTIKAVKEKCYVGHWMKEMIKNKEVHTVKDLKVSYMDRTYVKLSSYWFPSDCVIKCFNDEKIAEQIINQVFHFDASTLEV